MLLAHGILGGRRRRRRKARTGKNCRRRGKQMFEGGRERHISVQFIFERQNTWI